MVHNLGFVTHKPCVSEPVVVLACYGYTSQLLSAVQDLQTRLRGARCALDASCTSAHCADALCAGLLVPGNGLSKRAVDMLESYERRLTSYAFEQQDKHLTE